MNRSKLKKFLSFFEDHFYISIAIISGMIFCSLFNYQKNEMENLFYWPIIGCFSLFSGFFRPVVYFKSGIIIGFSQIISVSIINVLFLFYMYFINDKGHNGEILIGLFIFPFLGLILAIPCILFTKLGSIIKLKLIKT